MWPRIASVWSCISPILEWMSGGYFCPVDRWNVVCGDIAANLESEAPKEEVPKPGRPEVIAQPKPKYDVFINHRGPDVKKTFVAHLKDALCDAGFHPFMDAESIQQGSDIFSTIDEAISGAHVHVAVFSKNYAESKYCLQELLAMLQSNQLILPVFYDVEAQDLRQIKRGPFAKAFEKHERRGRHQEIKKWEQSLRRVADYRAFRRDEYNGYDNQLIKSIVEAVQKEMLLADGCHRSQICQQVSNQGWTIAPENGKFKWTKWWRFPRAGQGVISFAAQANSDVNIAITNSTEPRISIYEIVIGGWGNCKSRIREGQNGQDICVVATGLIYPGAVNHLWLSIDAEKEMIQVGRGKPSQDVICIYKGGHPRYPMTDAQCIFFSSGDTPITYSDIVVTDIDRIQLWDTYNFSKKGDHLVSDQEWLILPCKGHYDWTHHWKLPIAGRGIISFTSKGNNDIHVAISPRSETMAPMYEIVIRGWDRKQSVIRRHRQGLSLCVTNCNVLHYGTQFWVSIDDHTRIIQVGEGEPCHNVICVYKDPDFISEAQHVSFTTWDVPVTYSNVAITTIEIDHGKGIVDP